MFARQQRWRLFRRIALWRRVILRRIARQQRWRIVLRRVTLQWRWRLLRWRWRFLLRLQRRIFAFVFVRWWELFRIVFFRIVGRFSFVWGVLVAHPAEMIFLLAASPLA
jgi:hypothetical protein